MLKIMNVEKEDLGSSKKCRSFMASVIECGKNSLPLTCSFLRAGFRVIGVAANPHTFALLQKGNVKQLGKSCKELEKFRKQGVFALSSDIRKTASLSDIIVITIQPQIGANGRPDYSHLERICREVGMGLNKSSMILFFTNTGPGTVEGSLQGILEKTSGLKTGADFGLASAFTETDLEAKSKMTRSRIVLGAADEANLRIARMILRRIENLEISEVSSIKTIETLSLLQNLQDEVNVALANELAYFCERLDIDFVEVLKIHNEGKSFHVPYPGIVEGASRRAFHLLLEEAENASSDLRLVQLARKINDKIVDHIFGLVKNSLKTCGKTVRRAKISVLGISQRPNFKKPPGRTRRRILDLIKSKVRTVQVYDPYFSEKDLQQLGLSGGKLSKVVEGTDCILVLTDHSKFRRLNLKSMKLLAKRSPVLIDVGHIIDPERTREAGIMHRGLGRGTSKSHAHTR